MYEVGYPPAGVRHASGVAHPAAEAEAGVEQADIREADVTQDRFVLLWHENVQLPVNRCEGIRTCSQLQHLVLRTKTLAPSVAFGLWAFVSKLSLAIAAGTLLPILGAYGFQSGQSNTPDALHILTLLYAVVPCGLKLVAMAVLAATPVPEA